MKRVLLFNKTNLLLLFIAFLWGVGFVFQRNAMDYMGPITFNAYRFLIAAVCLLPILFKSALYKEIKISDIPIKGGGAAGCVLFFAAIFQQFSIQYTSLANVGFITGLYVVIVPLLGMLLGHRYKKIVWFGGFVACSGLYILSGFRGAIENTGDFLALIGAIFWAMHIIVVSIIVKRFSPYLIAFVQFLVCGILSLMVALLFEENIVLLDLRGFFWVVTTGIIITAFAYTLQIIAQADAEPFNAAIIFGLEAVFAAIAGYFIFQEGLTLIEIIGCLLMFSGCLVSQYPGKVKIKDI